MQLKGPTNFLFSIFILFMQEYKWLWLITLDLYTGFCFFYITCTCLYKCFKDEERLIKHKKSFFCWSLGLNKPWVCILEKKYKIISLSGGYVNFFCNAMIAWFFHSLWKNHERKHFIAYLLPLFECSCRERERERVNACIYANLIIVIVI